MQRALQNCSRISGDAITLEDEGKNLEAYQKYINCCLKAYTELASEANTPDQQNVTQRLELAKLANLCSERIVNFCELQAALPFKNGIVESPAKPTSPISPQSPLSTPETTRRPAHFPTSLQSPSLERRSSKSPSVDMSDGAVLAAVDPMKYAKILNQKMVEHLKKRLEKMECSPQRRANMTQELFRKISENNEKAKLMQEQQRHRQQKLKSYADKRTRALNLKDPAKKKEHEEWLASILIHDDKFKWPLSLKSQLKHENKLDVSAANDFCTTILRSTTHPMSDIIKTCHSKVKAVTDPLHEKYSTLVSDTVLVPYLYSEPLLSDEAVAKLEVLADDSPEENTFSTVEENCNVSVDEIKLAKYMTDKEISKLINDDKAGDTQGDAQQEVVVSSFDDEMDYLFDSEDDEVLNDKVVPDDVTGSVVPGKLNNLAAADELASKIRNELDEVEGQSAAFKEHLSTVTGYLHETMHCLSILFRLAYEPLNSEEGYDVINTAVLECLFSDIGDQLQILYRLANLKKERKMAEIMTSFIEKDISHMQVNEKWYLDTRGECYNHLVSHLRRITAIHSPLEKALSCTVRLHAGVVETAEAFYAAKHKQEPMGADDLLPIICYIVVKSQIPQIISQCNIMADFIPPEYMMEQEGYCLSTVQMAVEYLLTL